MRLKLLDLAILTAFLSANSAMAFSDHPLDIVLTNDDGWNAAGIQTQKRQLVAQGHRVVLVAPLDQQSGSSAAINMTELSIVKQRNFDDEGAMEYSVAVKDAGEGAEPATSAAVGISIATQLMDGPPDLLISGINAGQNPGAATQISGTVGAAIAAISTAIGGASIPAIAVSTSSPCDDSSRECEEATAAQYERVAAFTTDLVAALAKKASGGELMPRGLGLNINYPPVDPIRGAVVSRQGRSLSFPGVPAMSINFGCRGDCIGSEKGVAISGGPTGSTPLEVAELADADTTSNQDGYITLVPITPDYSAGFGNPSEVGSEFRAQMEQVLDSMTKE